MIDKYSGTSGTAVAQIVEPFVVGAEYKGVVVVLVGDLEHEYGAEFVCATTKSTDDARRIKENQTATGKDNFIALRTESVQVRANLQVARLTGLFYIACPAVSHPD